MKKRVVHFTVGGSIGYRDTVCGKRVYDGDPTRLSIDPDKVTCTYCKTTETYKKEGAAYRRAWPKKEK